jgi:hypothetical protein
VGLITRTSAGESGCAFHNSIGQEIAPFGTADRRFAAVTEARAHPGMLGAISTGR